MSPSTRQQIRTLIRGRRQAIRSVQQAHYALDLVERAKQLLELRAGQKVALYLATDGELDTQPMIEWCWQQGIETYLPVIHPFSKGHLLFLHYAHTTPLVHNQYKILEPKLDKQTICPVADLDVIFTPLVAFDDDGQRLGMGGGYYDRTLAPFATNQTGPKTIGLAHDCQQVGKLPIESWDIPLSTIMTPSKICRW